MVEYGHVTKGYRLYDATERKIIHIHGVQFYEKTKECQRNKQDTARSDYQLIVEFSEVSEIEMDDTNQLEQGAKKLLFTVSPILYSNMSRKIHSLYLLD